MGDVRNAYAQETDPAMQRQLITILDTEDPMRVILGRGMIPGRTL